MMDTNIYKRISKIEAITNLQKSDIMETLQAAYDNACTARDEEQASILARAIRKKLLDESDKEMMIDRLNLDTSSVMNFVSSIGEIFKNNWAVYRQKLRDLPLQEGFPFEIKFPLPPEE